MHSSVSENVVTMEIFEHSHMYQLVSICVISYVIDKYNNQLRVVCVQVHVYMCRNTQTGNMARENILLNERNRETKQDSWPIYHSKDQNIELDLNRGLY